MSLPELASTALRSVLPAEPQGDYGVNGTSASTIKCDAGNVSRAKPYDWSWLISPLRPLGSSLTMFNDAVVKNLPKK